MSSDQRMLKILQAPPDLLERVDAVLAGRVEQTIDDVRLHQMGKAADRLGISKTTLWRAIKDNRIRTVEVRRGSRRIPESELRRFAGVVR